MYTLIRATNCWSEKISLIKEFNNFEDLVDKLREHISDAKDDLNQEFAITHFDIESKSGDNYISVDLDEYFTYVITNVNEEEQNAVCDIFYEKVE